MEHFNGKKKKFRKDSPNLISTNSAGPDLSAIHWADMIIGYALLVRRGENLSLQLAKKEIFQLHQFLPDNHNISVEESCFTLS